VALSLIELEARAVTLLTAYTHVSTLYRGDWSKQVRIPHIFSLGLFDSKRVAAA
jgi:hypothetical protein